MKYFFVFSIFFTQILFAQDVREKLDAAVTDLLHSEAMSAGQLSFYVTDESGQMVYDFQPDLGLSSASTQKIFTAAAALELLGKDYKYTTTASISGPVNDGVLDGNLYIHSNGDPTLGSWRYLERKSDDFQDQLLATLKKKGIKKINGDIIIDDSYFDFQKIPGGWSWDDIGNYFGAGVWGVNWRENQFDIHATGNQVKSYSPELVGVKWVNDVETGGSADNSFVFTAPFSDVAYINGMLPGKKVTTVAGAMPNPPLQLAAEIAAWLKKGEIEFSGKTNTTSLQRINGERITFAPKSNTILEFKSPALEKIVHWFLQKSVNLYGETLLKTIGKTRKGDSRYGESILALRDFWVSKGIKKSAINFADGSGLSPQNYVSTKAEVQALVYAQKRDWFPAFQDAFPTYNAMKMKSGTIKNTKAYAGYHTSKEGKNYVFSIIINNYQGPNANAALFKILDHLK